MYRPPDVDLSSAPVDVQEAVLTLMARYLHAKKTQTGFPVAQIKAGVEEAIRRWHLKPESVYNAFPLDNPDISPAVVWQSINEYLSK